MGGRRKRSLLGPPVDLREQLAQEAARVMVEGGIEDFGLAKRKAAERLGVKNLGALPSNAQIQACLAERQRIFEPSHERRLEKLRRIAVDVMAELEQFRPKLVGPVLEGTATINASVEVHAFSDAPEAVADALASGGARVHDCQRRYRFGRDDAAVIPGFELERDDEQVQVMVFAERAAHHAPWSPVDQKPMRRASRSAVLALLEA